MKVLVTGGAGFIGSYLVETLLSLGYKVLIIDNLSTGKKEYVPAGALFEQIDIIDKEKLTTTFLNFSPDFVFHLAAQKDVRFSVAQPFFDAQINILASIHLLELAIANKIKKFIFVSSGGAIYDETDLLPFTEYSKPRPLSPYGLAKYTIDLYLDLFKNLRGLPYASFRLANVYGPRQDPLGEAGVVAIFFNKLLAHNSVRLNGGGIQTRDFIYVKDVVSALILGLDPKATGIYNVGTGIETSIKKLLEMQQNICNENVDIEIMPVIPGEVMRNILSYSRLNNELHWQPVYDLEKGLLETKRWCEKL
jgi:UDP-glucose 4-epimerase